MKNLTLSLTAVAVLMTSAVPAQAASKAPVKPRECKRILVDQPAACAKTLMSLHAIQGAVEAYFAATKAYPKAATYSELKALLEPAYAKSLPAADAWDTPFRYVPPKDGAGYLLVSAGSDRAFQETSWSTLGITSSSAEDAVASGANEGREWTIQE